MISRRCAIEASAGYPYLDLAPAESRATWQERAHRAGQPRKRTLGVAGQHLGGVAVASQAPGGVDRGLSGVVAEVYAGFSSSSVDSRDCAGCGTARSPG